MLRKFHSRKGHKSHRKGKRTMRGGIRNYCTTQPNSQMCNAQEILGGAKATKSRKHARSHKRHAKRGGIPDGVINPTARAAGFQIGAGYQAVLGGKARHAKKASRKVHHRRHRGGSQQTCGPVAPQAGAQCNSGSAQNYAAIMVGHADAQLQSALQKMYS